MASRALLEVERKFLPSLQSTQLLRANAGSPSFTLIHHQGRSCFRDTYIDIDDKLASQGIWVRKREPMQVGRSGSSPQCVLKAIRSEAPVTWQVKLRKGGDFINSAFVELEGEDECNAVLDQHAPGLSKTLRALNCDICARSDSIPSMARTHIIARFVTSRQAFKVNNRYNVVIDHTDFGHRIGEVELKHQLHGVVEQGSSAYQSKVVQDLDLEIESFMRAHRWAFPEGEPIGKLSAYAELKKGRSFSGSSKG